MELSEILRSSSAEAVATNSDLLTEILLLLPAKPLITFKCVSKQWLSLISSPHFCHRHTRQHNTAASAIFLRRSQGFSHAEFDFVSFTPKPSCPPFSSLGFEEGTVGIKILQSCNGLFLCCSFRLIGATRSYFIYNPTTNHSFTLPLPHGFDSTTVLGVNLAFQPSKSPYYNVVCVHTSSVSIYYYQIEIYSSETRTWRLSGEPFVAPFDMVFHNGVFWNGAIHWLSPSGSSMYFIVDREQFGTMPMLPARNRNNLGKRFRYFGESQGHLHLIEIYGRSATQFDVFEIEWDYSKWFVKYKIDFNAMVKSFPEMNKNFLDPNQFHYLAYVILSLFRDENGEDSALLLHIPGKVISYNVKDKSFKKLCDIAPLRSGTKISLQFGCFDTYQYFQTLACV